MTVMKSEREREREETSWIEDKEARHQGVKFMQMMTLSVLRRVNEEGKINKIFFFKKGDETAPGLL